MKIVIYVFEQNFNDERYLKNFELLWFHSKFQIPTAWGLICEQNNFRKLTMKLKN